MTPIDPPPPKTEAKPLARAAVREVLAKTPVLGSVLKVIREAEEDTRKARQERWLAELASGAHDPQQFSERLANALAGDEGDAVRAAILESARAALDAVDEAAIPCIGRLTRRFLTTRTPAPRVFRNLMAMFKMVESETLDTLRSVVTRLRERVTTDDIPTNFLFDIGAEFRCWNWYAVVNGAPGTITLATGDAAYDAVVALLGTTSNPFSKKQGDFEGPLFTAEMRELLEAIL
ncbi:MAG TPA: hypothetical protein VGG28_05355 [Kofleriaceae bacterium]|jgi:hypothetical protein